MPSSNISYKTKYVCFLDILGFSNAIVNPNHPHFARTASYFLTALKVLENVPSRPDLFLNGIEISQFSDCVAFSCADDPTSLFMFLNRVAELQRELIKGGLASRGAVTKGQICHQNGYIFGPALIQAVKMEEVEAKLPRVVLSYDILQDIASNSGFNYNSIVERDSDGLQYVQYVENWGNLNNAGEFVQLKETILLGLRDIATKEKYEWLAKKFNIRLSASPVSGVTQIVM